jgi:hypothetical protein
METEIDENLSFVDINIYRRPEGCLGHAVYANIPITAST